MAPSSVTWQSSWHLARRHRSWRRARKYPRTPILSARFFSVLSAQNTTAAVHFSDRTARSLRRRPGRPPRSLPARRSPPRQRISPPPPRLASSAARSSPPPPPPVVRPRSPELAAPARSSANGRPPRATVGHRQVFFFKFLSLVNS
jgi:hypothetical protein